MQPNPFLLSYCSILLPLGPYFFGFVHHFHPYVVFPFLQIGRTGICRVRSFLLKRNQLGLNRQLGYRTMLHAKANQAVRQYWFLISRVKTKVHGTCQDADQISLIFVSVPSNWLSSPHSADAERRCSGLEMYSFLNLFVRNHLPIKSISNTDRRCFVPDFHLQSLDRWWRQKTEIMTTDCRSW